MQGRNNTRGKKVEKKLICDSQNVLLFKSIIFLFADLLKGLLILLNTSKTR